MTEYSEIYSYIRSMLGDTDPASYRYSDEMLDGHIRLSAVYIDSSEVQLDDENSRFTTDLDNVNKMRVTITCCLNILGTQPREFSYRSPLLSVTRKVDLAAFRLALESKLLDLDGGKFACEIDTSFDAIINEPWRILDGISVAIAKQG